MRPASASGIGQLAAAWGSACLMTTALAGDLPLVGYLAFGQPDSKTTCADDLRPATKTKMRSQRASRVDAVPQVINVTFVMHAMVRSSSGQLNTPRPDTFRWRTAAR